MSTTSERVINITREELYERVWATPMRRPCTEFDLSDVGLAKVCKVNDIPRPPAGYWAKREHGKALARPPLPNRPDLRKKELTFTIWPEGLHRPESPPVYDNDVTELLESVRSWEKITVADHLGADRPPGQETCERQLRWPTTAVAYLDSSSVRPILSAGRN